MSDLFKKLEDKYPQLFFWIDGQFAEDELPPEPSALDMAISDASAEELLLEMREEDDKNTYGNI